MEMVSSCHQADLASLRRFCCLVAGLGLRLLDPLDPAPAAAFTKAVFGQIMR